MGFNCRGLSFLRSKSGTTLPSASATPSHSASATETASTSNFYTAQGDNTELISDKVRTSTRLKEFSYEELAAATNNFEKKLGSGTSGRVYRGSIDGRLVAVKSIREGNNQVRVQWATELSIHEIIEHEKLVKLIGYCMENKNGGVRLFLVYEYMPNGSVRDHLSGKMGTHLTWLKRLQVARDIADVLAYLHHELDDSQIFFRDLKASNILLDNDHNARLSDFGVARTCPANMSHVSTSFAGTKPYAAPEYLNGGKLTAKCDVWSYGVFLLELITGRKALFRIEGGSMTRLVDWARKDIEVEDGKGASQIIDSNLRVEDILESVQRLTDIARRCLVEEPNLRADMKEVHGHIAKLVDEVEVVEKARRSGEGTSHEGQSSSVQVQAPLPRRRHHFKVFSSCFR